MKSVFLIMTGSRFNHSEELYEGFCFESYGEAATFLNEVEDMFIRDVGYFDKKDTFYYPDNDDIFARIIEIPITKNKLERRGWFD